MWSRCKLSKTTLDLGTSCPIFNNICITSEAATHDSPSNFDPLRQSSHATTRHLLPTIEIDTDHAIRVERHAGESSAHLPTRRAQGYPYPALRTGGRGLGLQVHRRGVSVRPVQSISHASSIPTPTALFVIDILSLCAHTSNRPTLFSIICYLAFLCFSKASSDLTMPVSWDAALERKLLLCSIDLNAKLDWHQISQRMGPEYTTWSCMYVGLAARP